MPTGKMCSAHFLANGIKEKKLETIIMRFSRIWRLYSAYIGVI